MTYKEKCEILQRNIEVLDKKLSKYELEYMGMHTRETLTTLRTNLEERLSNRKIYNSAYSQGLIDVLDFVLSKKPDKEILLQK